MSANILCKPLLKTLPCLVMIRDDVMFALLFKARFLGLIQCFDTHGWMRGEKTFLKTFSQTRNEFKAP